MNKEAQLATMLTIAFAVALFGWALVYLASAPTHPHDVRRATRVAIGAAAAVLLATALTSGNTAAVSVARGDVATIAYSADATASSETLTAVTTFLAANQGTVLPDYWRFDAFVEAKISPNWQAKLFVNNITNKLYYDALYQSATPFVYVAPGRSASLVPSAKF